MHSGDIAHFESKIVYTGRTSLKVYVALRAQSAENPAVSGFITFVHVDDNGAAIPHGIVLELNDPHDIKLNLQAANLT